MNVPAPLLHTTLDAYEPMLLFWLRQGLDEHDIVAITDAEGVIRYVNQRFCEISGYAEVEIIGKTHRVLKSGEHPDSFYEQMWATLLEGEIWRGAICNRAKNGELYWVQTTILPLLGLAGRKLGFLAIRTDVTRLVQMERELALKTRELQLLFDHSPIGLSWREFGRDGKVGINHVNQRFCELIGLTREQAGDLNNVYRITHPEDLKRQEALNAEIFAGKRDSYTLEKRYFHSDGRTIWGVLTVVVVREKDGRISHHFGMLEDITSRHLAEDELRRTEARWRTYIQTASEILYALTPEGRIKFVSQAWTAKLGHPVDEVIGTAFRDYLHPEDLPLWDRFLAHTLDTGSEGEGIEYRVRHADGRWIWHASTGSAYSDRDRRRAFFGVGRDISVRRQAQQELRSALARLEEMARIIDRSPSVVVLWRAEGGNWPVEFVSASLRQFGYSPEDLISRRLSFRDITHPEDRERVGAEVDAHAAAGHEEYTQEYRIQCADGSVRWVDDHTIVRVNERGEVTHHEGLITDITERKVAEANQRVAQERELALARDVQQHLLPSRFPSLGRVEVEVLSQPSQQLGGDYYDVLSVDDRHHGFVIADVSGKGAPAALMMAACRASLRLCAPGEVSPAAVLRRVNRALQPDMPPGMYITLFYGILNLDTLELRFCRAGHEAGLLLRAAGGAPVLLGEGGMALGMVPDELFDATLEEGRVTLDPGDLLALYTDGINEACNVSGEEFGRDRVVETLGRHKDEPLAEILRRFDRYLRQFCTLAPRHDDRALLLVRAR
ncbi:MAG: PAS domain S-box protein [Verrucomicrobia bacterium]|nr:PAS domain S-box protein [Verrucomicrobiota bacterium]